MLLPKMQNKARISILTIILGKLASAMGQENKKKFIQTRKEEISCSYSLMTGWSTRKSQGIYK
jgi:hypothetical protein